MIAGEFGLTIADWVIDDCQTDDPKRRAKGDLGMQCLGRAVRAELADSLLGGGKECCFTIYA